MLSIIIIQFEILANSVITAIAYAVMSWTKLQLLISFYLPWRFNHEKAKTSTRLGFFFNRKIPCAAIFQSNISFAQ